MTRLVTVAVFCLVAAHASADAPGETPAETQARIAMQAWRTSNLAPKLIERCSKDFPEKAAMYGKAMSRWLETNADLLDHGKDIYALVVQARMPGSKADEVLAKGVDRALAIYDSKSHADKLEHCESAFMTLMVEVGPLRKTETPAPAGDKPADAPTPDGTPVEKPADKPVDKPAS